MSTQIKYKVYDNHDDCNGAHKNYSDDQTHSIFVSGDRMTTGTCAEQSSRMEAFQKDIKKIKIVIVCICVLFGMFHLTQLWVLAETKVKLDNAALDEYESYTTKSENDATPAGREEETTASQDVSEKEMDKNATQTVTTTLATMHDVGRCQHQSGYTWYSAGGFCYKFHQICATWEDARAQCQSEGGDLIMLKTVEAVAYFKPLLKQHLDDKSGCNGTYGGGQSSQGNYWVGATDRVKEGTWTWVDGSPANTDIARFWAPGEPSNGNVNEHCLHIWSKHDFKYNDVRCSSSQVNSFICAI